MRRRQSCCGVRSYSYLCSIQPAIHINEERISKARHCNAGINMNLEMPNSTCKINQVHGSSGQAEFAELLQTIVSEFIEEAQIQPKTIGSGLKGTL